MKSFYKTQIAVQNSYNHYYLSNFGSGIPSNYKAQKGILSIIFIKNKHYQINFLFNYHF